MPVDDVLYLHNTISRSRANGPGIRAVIWLQGCNFHCPGCFNPETHQMTQGKMITISALVRWIVNLAHDPVAPIEGITISGGEPLLQWGALSKVLQIIKKHTDLSVLIFTGFEASEIASAKFGKDVIALSDVIIAGRYRADLRIADGLIGSSNKTILFNSSRYSRNDLDHVPAAEVIIRGGEIIVSGINPMQIGGIA